MGIEINKFPAISWFEFPALDQLEHFQLARPRGSIRDWRGLGLAGVHLASEKAARCIGGLDLLRFEQRQQPGQRFAFIQRRLAGSFPAAPARAPFPGLTVLANGLFGLEGERLEHQNLDHYPDPPVSLGFLEQPPGERQGSLIIFLSQQE